MVEKNISANQRVECLRGAEEICDFVKEDRKRINELVRDEGLPAWKREEGGIWRALNVDLQIWMIKQRTKYLRDSKRYVEDDQKKPVNI